MTDTQASGVLAVGVLLLVYCVIPKGVLPAVPGMSPDHSSSESPLGGFDPYQQGYEDGQAGLPRKYGEGAWAHCLAPGASAPDAPVSGGWGIMKLVYLGIMGQRVFQMGGTPWSPQNLVENIKANPQQGLMLAFFLYNMLG